MHDRSHVTRRSERVVANYARRGCDPTPSDATASLEQKYQREIASDVITFVSFTAMSLFGRLLAN